MMEAFGLYLLKSVIWLSGFTLVYFLFLRNERFFALKRFYLLAGIITSFFFPFISVHYTVDVSLSQALHSVEIAKNSTFSGSFNLKDLNILMLIVYFLGALVVMSFLYRQIKSVIRLIIKAEVTQLHPVKLIRTADYSSPFSFFSYVFVNPSITEIETREIVIHELVHIRQKHWFDLLLMQLLCMLQWFNPLVWVYVRYLRQNHEYLADEVALQRTADPAIYKAALLNQIVGAPVVNLANSFNYSINTKRFNMMKNIIRSPYRKMKLLLILPVFAIVLYSFAKPDYRYSASNGSTVINNQQGKEVKGIVTEKGGKPLSGAVIVLRESTVGTISDPNGKFKLTGVPDDASLVVIFAGYKSKVLKPVFNKEMYIEMVRDTVKVSDENSLTPPPPPPPPPPPVKENIPDLAGVDTPPPPPPPPLFGDGPQPLIVIDGKISDVNFSTIDPGSIGSISVLSDVKAKKTYGEKGKNGVLVITLKKKSDVITISDMNYSTKNDQVITVTGKNSQDSIKKSSTGSYKVSTKKDK